MKTEIRVWESAADAEYAASVLKNGGLVVFPTETVYGLGALMSRQDAVERIYAVKERERKKPLSILLKDASGLAGVADLSSAGSAAEALAKTFWPGPLTMVLKKNSSVPDYVTAGQSTVGIRIPDHAFALALLKEAGEPIVTTSANLSGRAAAVTAEEAAETLDGLVDLVIDGGSSSVGTASTVLSLTGKEPVIFREGTISAESLLKVIDKSGYYD